jgi:ribosomal protein S18 acetylase RimI-like enzyme
MMAAGASVQVRPARAIDARAVAALFYETSPALHDRFAGDRRRALRLLEEAFERSGTNASAEVARVAELGSEVAAAMACFRAREVRRRGDALLRLALSRTPPWRWHSLLLFFRRGRRTTPSPPADSLYVDSLASDPRHRRRGAARALLARAEEEAVGLGLGAVSLETEETNSAARSLYENAGFVARGQSSPAAGFPGFVLYVKESLKITPRAP